MFYSREEYALERADVLMNLLQNKLIFFLLKFSFCFNLQACMYMIMIEIFSKIHCR